METANIDTLSTETPNMDTPNMDTPNMDTSNMETANMDRPTKRRRDPEDAPVSIKVDNDGEVVVKRPTALETRASCASLRGPDPTDVKTERPSRLPVGKPKARAVSAPVTTSSTVATDSHAVWSKKWGRIFPAELLKEVGKRRNPSALKSESTGNRRISTSFLKPPEPTGSRQFCQEPAVYFVQHSVSEGYDGQEAEILGTYADVASANEHVMVHFAKQYRFYGLRKKCSEDDAAAAFPRSKKRPDHKCACWDTDEDGCLILKANMYERGFMKLAVLKQPILREPPALRSKPRRESKRRAYF